MIIRAFLAGVFLTGTFVLAQPPDSNTHFETSSVRPSQPTPGCFSMLPPGSTQFALTCAPLRNLIAIAYGTKYIEGGGQELDTSFDVRATTPGDKPWTQDSIRPMMRQLLAERFQLVAHQGKRDLSGYRLIVAKGGPKITPVSPDPALQGQKAGEPARNFVAPGRVQGRNVGADAIAKLLSIALQAPVTDSTGLTGIYNVDLKYAPDNNPDANLPSVFTAVEEQLGLKLQPDKVTVDTLVIDHLDAQPTPN
jgi:uncharacterized protein (TIGR03435 family)